MSQPDLTPAGREALAAARQEAERLRHGRLGSEHLLLGLLAHADPATLALLAGRGLDPAAVRAQLEQGLSPGNAAPEDEITWRPRALRVLETSHPPVYYLPIDDFAAGALTPGQGSSFCEFKGAARYLDVYGGGVARPAAAWNYPHPEPGYEALAKSREK